MQGKNGIHKGSRALSFLEESRNEKDKVKVNNMSESYNADAILLNLRKKRVFDYSNTQSKTKTHTLQVLKCLP